MPYYAVVDRLDYISAIFEFQIRYTFPSHGVVGVLSGQLLNSLQSFELI